MDYLSHFNIFGNDIFNSFQLVINVIRRVIHAYLQETGYREVSAVGAWRKFMILRGIQALSESLESEKVNSIWINISII